MTIRELLALPALCSMLSAQSMSAEVLAPIESTATSGGQTQSIAVGPGAMSPNGVIPIIASSIAPSFARAEFEWRQLDLATELRFRFDQRLEVVGPAPGEASIDPAVMLLTISAPTPTAMTVHLRSTFSMPAGAAQPLLRVDVGNDGSVEFTESSLGGGTQVPVFVGAPGLAIRVEVSSQLRTAGALHSGLDMQVVPNNNTLILPVGLGCDAANVYEVRTNFDGNLEVGVRQLQPTIPPFSFAIFGLSTQPIPLGTVGQLGLPCVLWPSLDVAFFVGASYTLVIPPAARPIDIWTQSAVLSASPVLNPLLNEAYLVRAQ